MMLVEVIRFVYIFNRTLLKNQIKIEYKYHKHLRKMFDISQVFWYYPGSLNHILRYSSSGRGQYQGCSPRPTPPRPAEKRAAMPRSVLRKASPAPPCPTEIDKSRGAQRDTDYAHTFGLRVEKWRKSFSFGLLNSLWLSGLQKDHLKVRECNVFLDQNNIL